MVIRMSVFRKLQDPTLANAMASIDGLMATLVHLRTVTVETLGRLENTALEEKFSESHNSGRLRCRTCGEAQRIARRAANNPEAYSEQWGVVSPWYWDGYDSERDRWCVGVSSLRAPIVD